MGEYQAICEVCGDPFVPNGRRKKRCAKTHVKECANSTCNHEFVITANMKTTAEFCSHKCRGESSKRVNTCVVCGNTFHKVSKTCSLDCEVTLRAKTFAETAEQKPCGFCGKLFSPTHSTQKYCESTHYRECLSCGNDFALDSPMSKNSYCSSICASTVINGEEANAKRDATNMERYGTTTPQSTDEVKRRAVEGNLAKYGVEHVLKLDEFKEKVKANNIKKYGVEHVLQVPEIRAAIAKTNLEKYGHENPWGSKAIQDKIKETFMERYGVEWANQSDGVKSKRILTNLERYGVENVMMVPENIAKAQDTFAESVNNGLVNHRKVSMLNRNFAEALKQACDDIVDISFEQRFGSFQADLSLNDSKLLIDLHPTVSHNVAKSFGCVISGCADGCTKHKTVDRDYHFKRALAARDEGVSLLQCFDWDTEESIVKRVNAKIGKDVVKVSARKLELRKVTQAVANEHLSKFHIQGRAKGQSHCYALVDDRGTVLAIATFGASRFNRNYEYEFIRYAVREGYIIHGGSGALFKAFVKDATPSSVISYVDFNHTTGNTFLPSLGFTEDKPTGPALVYFSLKDKRKFSNTSVLSIGADRLLGTNYGGRDVSGTDNAQIMILEGFLPVYTAGNRVFVWRS